MLLAAALIGTLVRTWQAPNDWAEAHWLLDFRFGFVKRGLPGQLLAWFASATGLAVDERLIAGVAYALCAGFAALLFAIALRIAVRSAWSAESVGVGAAFLSSPFVVMTGNVMGYYDHLFLPMGIASVWLVQRDRWWTATLLQSLALFVHEGSILVAYPIFVLAAALRGADRAGAARRPPLPLVPVLAPLVVALTLDVVLPTVPADFAVHFNEHLRRHAFIGGGIENLGGAMLAGTFSQAFTLMQPFLGANLAKASSIGLVTPTILATLLLLLSRTRPAVASIESFAIAAVVLLPQSLHLIAWDLERLWTYSILLMFLVLWIYVERDDPAEPPPRGTFAAAFLAVCCNVVMETPLMGFVGERPSRTIRAVMLLALACGVLAIGMAQARMPLAARLRWRGRSLRDLLRR